MAGIHFVDRKNSNPFDAAFTLFNGPKELGDVSSWHVGDHVAVCFPGQGDKIDLIRDNAPSTTNFYASGDFLQVKCVVVRRFHSGHPASRDYVTLSW